MSLVVASGITFLAAQLIPRVVATVANSTATAVAAWAASRIFPQPLSCQNTTLPRPEKLSCTDPAQVADTFVRIGQIGQTMIEAQNKGLCLLPSPASCTTVSQTVCTQAQHETNRQLVTTINDQCQIEVTQKRTKRTISCMTNVLLQSIEQDTPELSLDKVKGFGQSGCTAAENRFLGQLRILPQQNETLLETFIETPAFTAPMTVATARKITGLFDALNLSGQDGLLVSLHMPPTYSLPSNCNDTGALQQLINSLSEVLQTNRHLLKSGICPISNPFPGWPGAMVYEEECAQAQGASFNDIMNEIALKQLALCAPARPKYPRSLEPIMYVDLSSFTSLPSLLRTNTTFSPADTTFTFNCNDANSPETMLKTLQSGLDAQRTAFKANMCLISPRLGSPGVLITPPECQDKQIRDFYQQILSIPRKECHFPVEPQRDTDEPNVY